MKWIVIISLGLIPIACFGQKKISDSLLFSLTLRSIDAVTSNSVNVFHEVIDPKILLNNRGKIALELGHFSVNDLASVASQVNSSIITTWDHDIFKKEGRINVVKNETVDQCLFISLPLISLDENVFLLYFENWIKVGRKKFGSGTVTVWMWSSSNEWILHRQQVIWTEE